MPNLHVYPKYWQLGLAATVAWLLVGYLGLTGQFEEKVDGVIVAFQETDENGNRRVSPASQPEKPQKSPCERIRIYNEVEGEVPDGLYYEYCMHPTRAEYSYERVDEEDRVPGCKVYRFRGGVCREEKIDAPFDEIEGGKNAE